MSDVTSHEPRSGISLKWVAAAILVVGLVFMRIYLPVGDWLEELNLWVAEMGPQGMVVYGGVYVIATVLFLPGSVLTIGAGFLFGVVNGTIVVSTGSTVGATLAFLISRYVARDWVAKRRRQAHVSRP